MEYSDMKRCLKPQGLFLLLMLFTSGCDLTKVHPNVEDAKWESGVSPSISPSFSILDYKPVSPEIKWEGLNGTVATVEENGAVRFHNPTENEVTFRATSVEGIPHLQTSTVDMNKVSYVKMREYDQNSGFWTTIQDVREGDEIKSYYDFDRISRKGISLPFEGDVQFRYFLDGEEVSANVVPAKELRYHGEGKENVFSAKRIAYDDERTEINFGWWWCSWFSGYRDKPREKRAMVEGNGALEQSLEQFSNFDTMRYSRIENGKEVLPSISVVEMTIVGQSEFWILGIK